MTRKRFSEEDILNILRQVEMDLAGGATVESAIRTAGISDATYYKWRKMYGGVGKAKLHEFKEMEKENARLKRIVADLELVSSPLSMYHCDVRFPVPVVAFSVSLLGPPTLKKRQSGQMKSVSI